MLNMRSVSGDADLTARARIRDAAIELFGARGFERTSVRAIAEAAGVSPALVLHHFGDKQGLRAACDAHVAAAFTDDEHGLTGSPSIEAIQAAMGDLDAYGPALDYLAGMLADGDDQADAIFEALLEGTRTMLREQERAGVVRPMDDADGTALLVTVFGLAPLVLRRQMAKALGEPALTPSALARITLPTIDLLTHGLYRDDSLLLATRQALGVEQPPTDP